MSTLEKQAVDGGRDDVGQVAAWRLVRFRQMGIDDTTAAEALAERLVVDLHDFEDLCDHGCDPVVAARILWPLDS